MRRGRGALGACRVGEVFLEGQRADGFGVGVRVEQGCVAGGQVEAAGLGLARAGGEVQALAAARAGDALQLADDAAGEAAPAVRGVRPDALEFGGVRVVAAEGAAA